MASTAVGEDRVFVELSRGSGYGVVMVDWELDVTGSVQSLTIVQGVAVTSMGYDGIATVSVSD